MTVYVPHSRRSSGFTTSYIPRGISLITTPPLLLSHQSTVRLSDCHYPGGGLTLAPAITARVSSLFLYPRDNDGREGGQDAA